MRPRVQLGWPFALVGALVGGGVLAWLPRDPLHLVLALVAPVALGAIGVVCSARDYRGWLLPTVICSCFFAALLGRHDTANMIASCLAGLLVFPALGLPLEIFVRAAREARVARTRSLAARVEDHFVWVVGLMPFDLLAGAIVLAHLGEPAWALPLVAVAFVMVPKLAFLAEAILIRRRLRGLGLATHAMRPLDDAHADQRIDLGAGEAVMGRPNEQGSYRAAPTASVLIVGDAPASIALVSATLARFYKLLLALYGTVALVAAIGFVLVCRRA